MTNKEGYELMTLQGFLIRILSIILTGTAVYFINKIFRYMGTRKIEKNTRENENIFNQSEKALGKIMVSLGYLLWFLWILWVFGMLSDI